MLSIFGVRRQTIWLAAVGVLALVALAAPLVANAAVKLPSKRGAAPPPADFDARSARVAPTAAQEQLASSMGASVEWNRFGTPSSMINHSGFLGSASGVNAEAAARNWIAANKVLFRLASLESLRTDSAAPLKSSDNGHVITFRQVIGGLTTTRDGHLTVGLKGTPSAGWKVVYVSSSLTGGTGLVGPAQMSATEAWVKAAANAGRTVSVLDVKGTTVERGWTVLGVAGYEHARARLVALPLPGSDATPAFETLFVTTDRTSGTTAFRSYVDARTGAVLVRQNIVFHNHVPTPTAFNGTTPVGDCDVDKPLGVVHASPQIRAIDVIASFVDSRADLVLKLKRDGFTIASIDTGTSPEALHHEPAGGVVPGTYSAQVCHLAGSTVPQTGVLRTYVGGANFVPVGASSAFAHPPKWRVFPAYPKPSTLVWPTMGYPWNIPNQDIRKLWCWDTNVAGTAIPGCSEEVKNRASPAPWDFDTKLNLPTYTTRGNNAISAESWVAEILNPGPTSYRPISATRTYDNNVTTLTPAEFSNDWFEADTGADAGKGCAQVSTNPQRSFTPTLGYDISSSVVNLFAMHNRMHDWTYHLGFTEEHWNAQEDNFGETPPTQENDSLIGNAQEAALTGPTPVLGRTNANMVPLPEGVRPITNMYLWQPFAGVIYVPCVDGDFDMSIIGHEYGHLVENRMVAKGGFRFGHEAGSMGEGYGDLMGMEVLLEYGYLPVLDENPYSIGAYVSGNKQRSIRNYAPNRSPLNYSDIGFDFGVGDEVHSDGEIWVTVNFDIRQALVNKYNATSPAYPSGNKALQRECAQGVRPATVCPGNRRWAQLLFTGMLLMPADPTMLDARQAMFGADMLHFGGANLNDLWLAYARRGFGLSAYSTPGGNDTDPRPDFASARHANTTVTFSAQTADGPDAGTAPDPVTNATIYVGDFEARVSPIADTNPNTNAPGPQVNNLDAGARFAPGTYTFIAHAPGFGHVRFTRAFTGGNVPLAITFPRNFASKTSGGRPVGVASCTPADPNDPQPDPCDLIDDTEGSAWQGVGDITDVPSVAGQSVTIDLAGGLQTINRVQVSAAGDPAESGKFSWLRQFEIWTCSANCTTGTGTAEAPNNAAFTKRVTSHPSFFPGDVPWPVAPHVGIRTLSLPSAVQATHVQLRVVSNQCTGQKQFHGEQDSDPLNPTDCITSPISLLFGGPWLVTAAELQVFGAPGAATGSTLPPGPLDPFVLLTKDGPETAKPGANVTYTISYNNLGPHAASKATIVDTLPPGTAFVSASGGGTYNSTTRKVTWSLGTVANGATGSRTLTIRLPASAAAGSVVTNTAEFKAAETVSPPLGVATTMVLP